MRLKIIFLALVILWAAAACNSRSEAEKIVDSAIEAHGGAAYSSSKIEFDFRDIHYTILKTPDRFEYIREFSDSTGNVKDRLNNEGFVRTVNGTIIDTLSDEWIGKYSRSVNSVAYFAFLPYGLNDPSVFKKSLGDTEIKGKKYHLIKVTFSEEGGGEDFDDEFLYWIDKDGFTVDYMAYSYHTDGGGVRMREVSNVQEEGGVRFQNYLNYKPTDESVPLENMQELYQAGELELLSEINLENIKVEPLEK
ncbi:hypothetical protein LZF95_01070 [Algoriphagus sp. AGSA1]|uniref:DUF6503 family protein n=1 Tax=Algoriphagus sp. AGSA1 TaxID=2907213 RepID=UPI001F2CD962|nr:DUF6503 family protein [Algoriphagus sp. AGSA1]MCE7053246.1 hypothetical protein [Algoriphagus sp. AGSA1]